MSRGGVPPSEQQIVIDFAEEIVKDIARMLADEGPVIQRGKSILYQSSRKPSTKGIQNHPVMSKGSLGRGYYLKKYSPSQANKYPFEVKIDYNKNPIISVNN